MRELSIERLWSKATAFLILQFSTLLISDKLKLFFGLFSSLNSMILSFSEDFLDIGTFGELINLKRSLFKETKLPIRFQGYTNFLVGTMVIGLGFGVWGLGFGVW